MTKLLHLAAIAIWAGGLIALPFMVAQRRGLEGSPLYRLHRMVRLLYVGIASPAAFIAIASGTALIFLQATFVEWFSIKLVLVGAMAALHVLTGLLVLSVFDPGGRLGPVGSGLLTAANLLTVSAILLVVLWKPALDATRLAPDLFQPGALGDMLEPVLTTVTSWVTQ